MEGCFLLNIVIRKRASIFQLLARKNEPLLVGGNPFLVLDLRLHVINGI